MKLVLTDDEGTVIDSWTLDEDLSMFEDLRRASGVTGSTYEVVSLAVEKKIEDIEENS